MSQDTANELLHQEVRTLTRQHPDDGQGESEGGGRGGDVVLEWPQRTQVVTQRYRQEMQHLYHDAAQPQHLEGKHEAARHRHTQHRPQVHVHQVCV